MSEPPLDPPPEPAGPSEEARALVELLSGVLDRTVAGFASYNVTLPTRQYWVMGPPAADCAQVVVAFIQSYLGPPGDEASRPQRCNSPRSAVLQVTVTREVPTVNSHGKPPTPEKIEAAAEISAMDAWILMEIAAELDGWDETNFGLGVIATVEAGAPEGGLQTSMLQLTLAVP